MNNKLKRYKVAILKLMAVYGDLEPLLYISALQNRGRINAREYEILEQFIWNL